VVVEGRTIKAYRQKKRKMRAITSVCAARKGGGGGISLSEISPHGDQNAFVERRQPLNAEQEDQGKDGKRGLN